jgi:hypothetical protein
MADVSGILGCYSRPEGSHRSLAGQRKILRFVLPAGGFFPTANWARRPAGRFFGC